MARPPMSRRHKLLAAAPALVVIGITALTASGLSVVTGATAASTVGVTGTVATAGSADPEITNPGADCADDGTNETLANFGTNFAATDGCRVDFYTNNVDGAEVLFEDDFGAAGAFFCSDGDPTAGIQMGTRSCATDLGRLDNVPAQGSTILSSSDRFGLALMTAAGGGTVAAGSGVSAPDATPDGTEAIWSPIDTTQRQLCTTSTPNTSGTLANCQFAFGGAGEGAGQGSGDYYGRIRLTIQQN